MSGMSSMQDLFTKVAQAMTTIPNNKDEMAPGRMQMREDAPDRQTSGPGAPWGEGSLSDVPTPSYSTAVERELVEGRSKLLERSFNGVSGMEAADKATMRKMFDNFGSASTTSHSPLLQKKASHAPPSTLGEAVRRLR